MQPWVMRPRRSTCVASTMTRPAPELASMPRWARCQSVAVPSSALYWHIGDTTMRLVNSALPSLMGVKRADMRFLDAKDFERSYSRRSYPARTRPQTRFNKGKWLRACGDPDDMPRAAPRSVGACPHLLDCKTGLAEAPGEFRILRRRPHRQDAAGT